MKRKVSEYDMDVLVQAMEDFDTLENDEYEQLLQGMNAKQDDKNMNVIVDTAYFRYKRYIEAGIIECMPFIQGLVNVFLQNTHLTLGERFNMMKQIDKSIFDEYVRLDKQKSKKLKT